MSAIETALNANQTFAQSFDQGDLPIPPARKLSVVACMDARLTVEAILGLETGDAHIIRNAGGIVSEDVIRSLLISHHLLGTEEIIIINHTDCGMLTFDDEQFRSRLHTESGVDSETPAHFHAFKDLEQNVRDQMETIRTHPWIPEKIAVRGFVYDVRTGRLTEVS